MEVTNNISKALGTPIDYFSTLPVVVLSSFNRGASFFLHGLIDGHDQVCTTPFIFPLLNLIQDNKQSNGVCDPLWISTLQRFMQEKLDNENSKFNLEDFSKYYLEFVRNYDFNDISRTIFYASHYAWSMLNNQDIYRLKAIFWHPHHHNREYENFFVNILKCKMLFTSKDPREALVSSYKYWQTTTSMLVSPLSQTSYLFDELILYYISSSLDRYSFYLENKNSSFVIKTEEMNDNPDDAVGKLAKFMNINVTDSLFSSTFIGHVKSSESSRGLEGFNKKINNERWQHELNDIVITFLELIHFNYMIEFNYSPKIVTNQDELMRFKGTVLRTLTRVPHHMRKAMLENAKKDSKLDNAKHLHPKLKKLEIFLRLMRKYLLLYYRCKNIFKHFRNDYKTHKLLIKNKEI